MASRSTDAFYVGYLPLPRAHRRFLQVALPVTFMLMIASAVVLATRDRPWGDGVWETGAATAFDGRLRLSPYPMLDVDDDLGTTSFLLVEMGKLGTQDRFTGDRAVPANTAATVWGRELRRDGRRMIEIDDDVPAGSGVILSATQPITAGGGPAFGGESVILTGEILDSKCYLGAMKPGRGRGHKACATLCVTGGIPPMLVVTGEGGSQAYMLLTNPRGEGLRGDELAPILPHIGEPVRITGRPGQVGSWRLLAIDPYSAIEPQ